MNPQFTEEELECPICRERLLDPIALPCCGASVCETCPIKLNKCPCCRHELNLDSGRPNALLRRLLEQLHGPVLESERNQRKERAIRAHEIKKIEKQYPKSIRCDLLRNALAVNPSGLVMTIPQHLLAPERLTELLPPNSSPVTEDEIFYNIEQSASDYIRVEKQLLYVGKADLNLPAKPLINYTEQDRLALLPLILHKLADRPELQDFVRHNQSALGLTGSTICQTPLSSFCHCLKEQDAEKPAPKYTKRPSRRVWDPPSSVEASSEASSESE